MSSLDVIQSFIDVSRRLRKPADLDALLQSITREMGFDHYALIHHVDLTPYEPELGHMATGQLVALMDYPEQWIAEYIGDDLVSYDPVLLASHRTNVGFAWSEIPKLIKLKRPHIEQLERGKRAGIADGFTVPSNVPGEANGSSNFVVKTGRVLPTHHLMMAQLVGSYAFEAARNIVTHAKQIKFERVHLSPRQLDCIVLIGQGKSTWDIAQILGIAESTVKEYIDDARSRYRVKSRIQLVLRAVYDGHLPLIDALR